MADEKKVEEGNEQGRGPARDLPEANVDPVVDDNEVVAEDENATEVSGVGPRTEAPVQAPHWQALLDIKRILPCQVQPVNTKDWYTVVDAKTEYGQVVLITSDGDKLYGRDIHDPVLCRTNDPDADLLH